jgi:MurE/MurF fusion protein
MQLKDYIPNIDKKYREVFFSGISFNSSKVKKNNIFFAIKGSSVDGNDYIEDAIKKGANIVITEKKISKKKNIIILHSSNVRKLLAEVSYKILEKKPKKLLAVTGTNGKSSIADFYYQILNLNSKKVASIGTIGVKYKDKKKTLSNTN